MTGNRTARRPTVAIALVAVAVMLAIFTILAWARTGVEPVRLTGRASGLDTITWAADVRSDGRMAVRITYGFSDDVSHTVSVRVPEGARYLAIDDRPVSASAGRYADATMRIKGVVAYELPGMVTRYRDGALLRMASINGTSLDIDSALFPCPRCYIDGIGFGSTTLAGALAVPGADDVTLTFIGLRSVRSSADSEQVRFVGIDGGADAVYLLATLPGDAVRDLVVRDGTVAEALATAKNELSAAKKPFHSPTVAEGGSRSVAVILTVLLAVLVLVGVARLGIRSPKPCS